MSKAWLLFLFSVSVSAAAATPFNIDKLNKLGEGNMQYLFWDLYHAELFRTPQNNQSSSNQSSNNQSSSDQSLQSQSLKNKPSHLNSSYNATALRLTYLKSVSKNDLLKATQDQWQHLGFPPTQTSTWLDELSTIWPDVKSGDQLTLFITPQGTSQFYLANHLIGTIDDPHFGEAFLDIWLSKNTSEPKLRKQLLGIH